MKKMHKEKKKIIFEGSMVSLPLLASFGWYAFVIFSSTKPTSAIGSTAQLAPGNIENLVIFLLLFIVAYSAFLVFEFRHLAHRWKKTSHHKK